MRVSCGQNRRIHFFKYQFSVTIHPCEILPFGLRNFMLSNHNLAFMYTLPSMCHIPRVLHIIFHIRTYDSDVFG
jgi:hypothetical protein